MHEIHAYYYILCMNGIATMNVRCILASEDTIKSCML